MPPKIHPVIIGIIRKENKYLLTMRHDGNSRFNGKWQLPGGGMEFAETVEEALRRELREEVGIEVNILHLLPTILTEVRGNWQGLFICFVCEMKNEDDEITLNEEATEFKWVTLSNLKNLELLPGVEEAILEAEKLR